MGKASRRKKQQKKAVAPPSSGPVERGFDLGLSSPVMVLGGTAFNTNLRKAEVLGVGYVVRYCPELKMPIPELTLLAKHEEPLKAAFEEFAHWAAETSNDAVELQIAVQRSGAYRVLIGPNVDALHVRALHFDDVVRPIFAQLTWIKQMDSVSPALSEFRRHLTVPGRPYYLSGSVMEGGKARFVDGIKPMLKFQITFHDENVVTDDPMRKIALGGKVGRRSKAPDEPVPKRMLSGMRKQRLKTLFPVSLWRAERDPATKAVFAAAEDEGLRPWQVRQGYCNLLLSAEVGERRPHFAGLPEKDWHEALVKRLQGRFEVSDGAAVTPIELDVLRRQCLLDGIELLRAYGFKGSCRTVPDLQRVLKEYGLL